MEIVHTFYLLTIVVELGIIILLICLYFKARKNGQTAPIPQARGLFTTNPFGAPSVRSKRFLKKEHKREQVDYGDEEFVITPKAPTKSKPNKPTPKETTIIDEMPVPDNGDGVREMGVVTNKKI